MNSFGFGSRTLTLAQKLKFKLTTNRIFNFKLATTTTTTTTTVYHFHWTCLLKSAKMRPGTTTGTTTGDFGKVKIAAIQLSSCPNKKTNLNTATNLITKAAAASAKMIFLPECFDYVAQSQKDTSRMAETLQGPTITTYRELAKKLKVWLSLGGFHLRLDEKKTSYEKDGETLYWVANTHIIINCEGEIVSCYKKVHLFDYKPFEESQFVKAGTVVEHPVQTPCGLVGLGICYDLRFPEFSQKLVEKGAQILTYPSAFTVSTGQAHWESLLRARAIESQCYVIAAAQVGPHNHKRTSYGHTMIVNPWGVVEGLIADQVEEVLLGEINLQYLNEIRNSMPVQNHRRPSVYYGSSSSNSGSSSSSVSRSVISSSDPKVPEINEANKNQTFSFGPIQVKRKFVFYESEYSWACVNRKCVKPGHVLVMPKMMVKRVQDLPSEMMSDFFNLASKVQNLMEFVHKVNSSTISIQDGPDAGQTVPHLHIHIIPRKPNDYEENDQIYKELEKHDKVKNDGQTIEWRNDNEMEKEAENLRQILLSTNMLKK